MTGLLLSSLVAYDSAFAGELTSLVVPGSTPAFDPAITQYTIPKTANCSIPVTATLTNPANQRLYICSAETASGVTRHDWVCDGKTDISVVILSVD